MRLDKTERLLVSVFLVLPLAIYSLWMITKTLLIVGQWHGYQFGGWQTFGYLMLYGVLFGRLQPGFDRSAFKDDVLRDPGDDTDALQFAFIRAAFVTVAWLVVRSL